MDPTGGLPLYEATVAGAVWLSNSAPILAGLTARTPDLEALASLVHAGWPLSGATAWREVRRLDADHVLRIARGRVTGGRRVGFRDRLPKLFAGAWSPAHAADTIRQSVRAGADWPGRRTNVPATAGRDSRTVLAAVARQGLPARTSTVAFPEQVGYPETPDVAVGRQVAERLGLVHEATVIPPTAPGFTDLERIAGIVAKVAPGTLSLQDTLTFNPDQDAAGVPEIVVSGLGGELARAFFHLGEGTDAASITKALMRRTTGWSTRPTPLNADGLRLVEGQVRGVVEPALAAGGCLRPTCPTCSTSPAWPTGRA